MILPTTKVPPKMKSPRRLFIYAAPKVGKTTAVSLLENNLILDFEGGTNFIEALKVEIESLNDLKKVLEEVKKQKINYKYVTVDTVTKLEELLIPMATKLYKESPVGINYTGDNVLTLPRGAGYLYLRKAFDIITSAIESTFERVIYVGHIKDKFLEKDDKEITAVDINLTGKLKAKACADSDAIGFLYREDKKVMISFIPSNDLSYNSVICGARQPHLANKSFPLVEMDETGNLISYWDKIFID